jgi:hypothetical protein
MIVSARRMSLAAAVLTLAITPRLDAQALPAAKELIQKYSRAVGGEAWKSHTSARMKATLEVPAAGMRADIEALHIFGDRSFFMRTNIAGLGEVLAGFDGKTAWSKEPMSGAKLLTGLEAEQAAEEADPEASLRTSSNIVKSETIEKTTMNNQECYKVTHTWKSGRTSHDCFSVKDGLIVATQLKQVSAMGELDVTTFLSDYKDFGGIKRPSTTTMQMMGQEIKTTVTAWEWDNVKPAEMEPPADIKALLKKGH